VSVPDVTNGNGNGAGGDEERKRLEAAFPGLNSASNSPMSPKTQPPWVDEPAGIPAPSEAKPRLKQTPRSTLEPNVPVRHVAETGDPIAAGEWTVKLGTYCHNVPFPFFMKHLEDAVGGRTGVRKGAASIQRLHEGEADQEAIRRTGADVSKLRADGKADYRKARRLQEQLDGLELELQGFVDRANAAEAARLAALKYRAEVRAVAEENRLEHLLQQEKVDEQLRIMRRARRKQSPRRRRGKVLPLLAKVKSPRWLGSAIFVIDGFVNALLIQPSLAAQLEVRPSMAYVLAGGLSVGVLLAAGISGLMLAAARISKRIVGLLLFSLFVAMMMFWLPGLEKLREGDVGGLETLTLSTGLAAYVALCVGYMQGVLSDADDEQNEAAEQNELDGLTHDADAALLKLLAHVGSDLKDASDEYDRSEALVGTIMEETAEHVGKIDALKGEIETLLDSHARTKVREQERVGQTQDARAREQVRDDVLTAQHAQEDDNAQHGLHLAPLEYYATVSEERSDDDDTVAASSETSGAATPPEPDRSGLIVAAASLAAGGVAGLAFSSPVLFAVGAGIAAAALLLPLLRRQQRTGANTPVASGAPDQDTDAIASTASTEDPTWSSLPSRMTARYRRGTTGPVDGH
jgi:hypothetical protein